MLPKDVFTEVTATLLNPMSNLGIDGGSQERLHDRHFVGLDQGVSGFVREEAETRHRDIFPAKNFCQQPLDVSRLQSAVRNMTSILCHLLLAAQP
jgi:hypothetical protein